MKALNIIEGSWATILEKMKKSEYYFILLAKILYIYVFLYKLYSIQKNHRKSKCSSFHTPVSFLAKLPYIADRQEGKCCICLGADDKRPTLLQDDLHYTVLQFHNNF